MKNPNARKLTRFYIINPVGDRRGESRFESQESILIKTSDSIRGVAATAFDIGQYGLKFESDFPFDPHTYIEISFPKAPDQIHCFGRVVWMKPKSGTKLFEAGVAIDSWHGIVKGENSWTKYKGIKPKPERRYKPR
jgi:hypothetical protein